MLCEARFLLEHWALCSSQLFYKYVPGIFLKCLFFFFCDRKYSETPTHVYSNICLYSVFILC